MPQTSDEQIIWSIPECGLGISGVADMEEAIEMLCILKSLRDWPLFYDAILQKLSALDDKRLKKSVTKKLGAWEDQILRRASPRLQPWGIAACVTVFTEKVKCDIF